MIIDSQSNLVSPIKHRLAAWRNWMRVIFFLAYIGAYLALLVWFKSIDVYHKKFGEYGIVIIGYNIFRVLFIIYLFWIVYFVGSLVLRKIVRTNDGAISTVDYIILAFFTGAGVWHIGMLALGLFSLYTVPVAIGITVPLVALSYREMCTTSERLYVIIAECFRTSSRADILRFGATVAVASAAAVLLIVKGLYPAGGHDYFTHYFYYLQSVIEHRGLWPNEVWYHFYYSKGAGLYFLGILLTDPMSPQLVTFCFFTVSALALFKLLRRLASKSLWPWAGVFLYIGLFIFTPGQGQYRANGGWGDFEKLHELNAAFVITILWMVAGSLERSGRLALTWSVATSFAIAAAVIINVTIALYLGALFFFLALWYLLAGQRRRSVICCGFVAVTGASMFSMLLINYSISGLVSDQGLLLFWRLADIEKLYNSVALHWVIMLHMAFTGLAANSIPLTFDSVSFIAELLRFELLAPLAVGGVVAAAVGLIVFRYRIAAPIQTLVLFVSFLVFIVFALSAGRSQPISFFRYSSFFMPISIALSIAMWATLGNMLSKNVREIFYGTAMPFVIVAGCVSSAFLAYPLGSFSIVTTNAYAFAKGSYSLDMAYTNQTGWAGRLPWGGIYAGARGAFAVVGPGTPIWSMHIHSYCMLPDCRIETYPAFTMTRDWDRVMFGSPEDGMAALKATGLNYFLFSRELARDLKIVDALPLSPLFAPNNISRYLGVRWTDGNTVLLTWVGPDTTPFDGTWLDDYRRAVEDSKTVNSFPYAAMKDIYARLRASKHPWQVFELPWEGNRSF